MIDGFCTSEDTQYEEVSAQESLVYDVIFREL